MKGKIYDLSTMKHQPMVIIYFFDVDSRPSQEGLLNIDQMSKQYKDADLMVWGVTRSSTNKVNKFIATVQPSFPVLIDARDKVAAFITAVGGVTSPVGDSCRPIFQPK